MNNSDASAYLTQFINKNLRVYTNDGRMFLGSLRCTDKDRNIILSVTHEYREPSQAAIRRAFLETGKPTAPMTSRFVGLVVVPGEYITKIEFEESVWSRDKVVP